MCEIIKSFDKNVNRLKYLYQKPLSGSDANILNVVTQIKERLDGRKGVIALFARDRQSLMLTTVNCK